MDLYEKIRKIELFIERTSSESERQAAEFARERLQRRVEDIAIEYKVSCNSSWEKKLFVAICKKNGFNTYRYRRQKYTTSALRVSERVMNTILWPEYLKYSKILQELVNEITNELIDKIYRDNETEEVISSKELEHSRCL